MTEDACGAGRSSSSGTAAGRTATSTDRQGPAPEEAAEDADMLEALGAVDVRWTPEVEWAALEGSLGAAVALGARRYGRHHEGRDFAPVGLHHRATQDLS